MPPVATIERGLRATTDFLDAHGIWWCVTYGTLLGGVRDGTIIEWDHDFDLFVTPQDAARLVDMVDAAGDADLEFRRLTKAPAELAYGAAAVGMFDPAHVRVVHRGESVGDLFAPTLFDDGVLRMYDLEAEVLWTPHSSFPHYFLMSTSDVTIDGRRYAGVGHPEQFLAGVYGDDWRVPYRSVIDGGEPRAGTTIHGDHYRPKLAREIAWCEAQGWDRRAYGACPAWPRRVRGAGPIGPTPRTWATTRSTWFTGIDELLTDF